MSEDTAAEALLEYLDACETGIAQAKRLIAQRKGVEKWDSSRIKWKQAEGAHGSYQRSEDVDSPDFKLLVKDLASHNGKFTKNGFFYWLFRNGSVVGRKKQK